MTDGEKLLWFMPFGRVESRALECWKCEMVEDFGRACGASGGKLRGAFFSIDQSIDRSMTAVRPSPRNPPGSKPLTPPLLLMDHVILGRRRNEMTFGCIHPNIRIQI